MIKRYYARFFKDPDSDGFTVDVPDLPGCITEGSNLFEALGMAKDAMQGWLQDEFNHGRPLPPQRTRAEISKVDEAPATCLVKITVELD